MFLTGTLENIADLPQQPRGRFLGQQHHALLEHHRVLDRDDDYSNDAERDRLTKSCIVEQKPLIYSTT